MNVSRIPLLFVGKGIPAKPTEARLCEVLTACCQAAKNRKKDRGYEASLTSELCGFPIDEVMWNLSAPYRICDVMATIKELRDLGYLNDDDNAFEIITLTDKLFKAIAMVWLRQAREKEVVAA